MHFPPPTKKKKKKRKRRASCIPGKVSIVRRLAKFEGMASLTGIGSELSFARPVLASFYVGATEYVRGIS